MALRLLERIGLGPRLILIGVSAVLVITGAGGWALRVQFHRMLWCGVEQRLADNALQLAGRLHTDADGRLWEERMPTVGPFDQIFSGWYWQIGEESPELYSRSLWDSRLDIAAGKPLDSVSRLHRLNGPKGEHLVGLRHRIALGDRFVDLHVYGPSSQVDRQVARLDGILLTSLTILIVVLTLGTVLQVHLGLRPLRRLRGAMRGIREGVVERVGGHFGPDLDPLAREMDRVLERNARVVARARAHAGDLSHALKKPLAVLGAEAQMARSAVVRADVVRSQVAVMAGLIERYLARAGSGSGERRRIDVGALLQMLLAAMRRMHHTRDLEWRLDTAGDGPYWNGEPTDLEEMLGNLLDNAGKWASRRVDVGARVDGEGTLVVRIDDDGPGLSDAQLSQAVRRGRRFDESVEGSGLGLAIVCDIAETYDGNLDLGRSVLGGIRARLTLPS